MLDKTMARGFLAVLLMVFAVTRGSGDTITLTTPGAGSATVPSGYDWTNVTVQCWGAGGGGGGFGNYPGGGGGGGGAYSSRTYTSLVAGDYGYYVGAGGAGSSFMSLGTSGGDTIWNYDGVQDIFAGGGYGGAGGGGGQAFIGGAGGIGGIVGAGTGYPGGEGGASYGYAGNGGGGGGSGSPGAPGGQGGDGTGSVGGSGGAGYGLGGGGSAGFEVSGYNGSFPGGGGGGGGWNWCNGGQGANGEIIITYTSQAVPEPSTIIDLIGMVGMGFVALAWHRRLRLAPQTRALR
jgi:hypothetical protein